MYAERCHFLKIEMALTPLIFFLLCGVCSVVCFDYDELEIFDLVEEVNRNFYELLGVDQAASASEIRKAYRRLSLQLHPDKNKEDNAEEKFRQMVAVYEVLKDKGKREVYNNVLEHGLPDWRQPVFYYRRVRKLGLLEITLLLLLIFTIGHFLVIWSVYFERRFELEEVIRSRKKKKKPRRVKQRDQDEEEFEEQVQEELASVPRPRLTDLIPCKLVIAAVAMVIAVPGCVAAAHEQLQERMKPKTEESEEEDEEEVKPFRRRHRMETVPDVEPEMASLSEPVLYNPIEEPLTDNTTPLDAGSKTLKDGTEWTDSDLALLSKAMAKLPGGTPHRWEKIAEMVGRSVAEVTAKSKKMKSGYAISVDPASQGITAKTETKPAVSNDVMTTRLDWKASNPADDSATRPPGKLQKNKTSMEHTNSAPQRPPKKTIIACRNQTESEDKKVVNIPNMDKRTLKLNNESDGLQDGDMALWSQNEQKIFEWTLNLYPRGTAERWEKIAEHLPEKTKEDCVARFRYLADIVKKKKKALQSRELSPSP